SASLSVCEVRQLELPYLNLVAGSQPGLVDELAVDVDAVQAPDVADLKRTVATARELRVTARDRYVVQEDVRIRVATAGREILLQQERRSRVLATLDQKQSLSGFELIVREGELILLFLFDLEGAQGQGAVLLQGMATL